VAKAKAKAPTADFGARIAEAYATKGDALRLGTGVHEDELAADAVVQVPLRMLNRHGLIAGATGTGKTRTLQLIAEQLSAAGVPTFLADVKSDVSGMAEPGGAEGAAADRMKDLGLPYEPTAFPVELYSLGGIGPGVPIRAAVSDFGPQLLAKILGANETQEQSLALVFRYADENALALVDLSDLRALLTYLGSDEGKGTLEGLGGVSSATIGVLLRSLVALEDGGGTEFFGEPQLAIDDLLRTAPDGRGVVSALELSAVQDTPTLWSTALMWLVAELFEELPEVGDRDRPKLVFFFDEAHLLFKDATPAFLDSVVRTVRLIRSKGVGVFFVTQSPTDLPRDVLGQLGNRVQHALRAFTPEDADALRQTVRTFPESDLYDLEQLLHAARDRRGGGDDPDEKGVPTPVVHTRLVAPRSSMSPAPTSTRGRRRRRSTRSTAPAPTRRARARSWRRGWTPRRRRARRPRPSRPRRRRPGRRRKAPPKPKAAPRGQASSGNSVLDFLTSRQGQAIGKEVVRGVFGMLKKRR
jgi:hypothetical protein